MQTMCKSPILRQGFLNNKTYHEDLLGAGRSPAVVKKRCSSKSRVISFDGYTGSSIRIRMVVKRIGWCR
jgi:hypothetical protein